MREVIASGADCYITGDVKYHQALDAEAAGLAVLDVGHYATEITCIPILQELLAAKFGSQLKILPLDEARDPLSPYTA